MVQSWSGSLDYLQLIEFLGRIVGKAIYDGILIELRLAPFFLRRMLGKEMYFDDLKSLDADLYKNLCFVKVFSSPSLVLPPASLSRPACRIFLPPPPSPACSLGTHENACSIREWMHSITSWPMLPLSELPLQNYEGDVEDLGLFFAVDEDLYGEKTTYPLIPGGAEIPVTREKFVEYKNRVSDYWLSRRIRDHSDSFMRGLSTVSLLPNLGFSSVYYLV